MPTAASIAQELRKVADLLDKTPTADLPRPSLYFSCTYSGGTKEQFIATTKVFPRPAVKGDGYDHDEITLTHNAAAVGVYASIKKDKLCALIEPAVPAKYACEPILSLEEEDALGGNQ